MTNGDNNPSDLAPVGLEKVGECSVLRSISAQPGVSTIEGDLVPLLSGQHMRSHAIVMHPGQYCDAHPHETESIIFTVSGSWVFCTIEDGEQVRVVINAGDIFHFPGGVPTGFETPFDEPAVIFIVKSGNESYDELVTGMEGARDSLLKDSAAGTPFSYRELPTDHPARVYARQVAGHDPAEVFS